MPILTSPALPAQALAAADVVTVIGTFEPADDSGLGVARVVVTPPPGYATVTGSAAPNNAQINVRQLRAGAVLTSLATLVLAPGTNLAAESPIAIPIMTSPALQQDDVVDVVLHQNGTGLAIPAGLVVEVDVA